MKKNALYIIGATSAALLFCSCSDSDDDNTGNLGSPGPRNTSSFTGSTITFNPTVTFTADGQISYVNEEENSQFDLRADEDSPTVGTFSYVANEGFRTGTITFTLQDETESAGLSDFVVQDGLVTSFTISFEEEGSFTANVTRGQIAAVLDGDGNNGGGGGGGGGGGAGGAENFTFESDGSISPGTTFTKEYLTGTEQGDISASPLPDFNPGDQVDFSIGNDGSLNFDGVSLPFQNGSDGLLRYGTATVTAVFDTGETSAASDLTITYTQLNISDPANPNVDGLIFAN